MPIYNTTVTYGSVAKTFHWLTALLIIGILLVGTWMKFFLNKNDQALMGIVYTLHKSTGLVILALLVLRLLWRITNPTPQLPFDLKNWQKIAAHASHHSLYLFAFLMALSGWTLSTAAGHAPNFFWLGTIPAPFIPQNKLLLEIMAYTHGISACILTGLIGVHVLAALYHHFVRKDTVLKRMLPGKI